MADINITITVPDAHRVTVGDAYIFYAKGRGDIAPEVTPSNAQVLAYIEADLVKRVKEIVLLHRNDVLVAAARQQAIVDSSGVIVT